ncbi:T9SS type A sorting domain-containing protein [Hymenobacter sp. NST-14]|nr:T9SS type A sorting domain-containing protein [Hymenobacter piscis]MBT9392700.1 T9SS type A sorting domain-containing protein [Hymenobacter piscis]
MSYTSTAALNVLGNDQIDNAALAPTTVDLDAATTGVQNTVTAANGIVYLANPAGAITFTNPGNYVGTSVLTYSVADANGQRSNNATLTLTLTNAAPVAAPVSTALLSSAPRTLLNAFAATDANGDGTIANYKFQVPSTTLGSFYTAPSGGTALAAGSQQTLTSANTLYFDPNGTGNGSITFDYTATDNAVPALTSAAATYTISLANVAPVAAAISTPVINNNGSTTRTQLPAFSATDPDGTVVNYQFTVPAGGSFYTTATGGTALAAGSVQTVAPAQALYYLPTGSTTATVAFTYTATDNGSPVATSAPATYTININQAPVAAAQSVTVIKTAGRTLLPAFFATDANGNGTVTSYSITLPASTPLGSFYRQASGGPAVTGVQTFTAAQANSLYFEPVPSAADGSLSLSYTATDGTLTSAPAAYTVAVAASRTISGRVFEDVNYGGGSGADYATANASATASGFAATQAGNTDRIGRSGVRVELYRNNLLVSAVNTAATGVYSFTNLDLNVTYTVRVVTSTLTSVRGTQTVVAVPTYIGAGPLASEQVGGSNPAAADAAANNTNGTALPAAAQVTYALAGSAGATNVDFGFSYDVVVNTNDTGYGSLRQFVANANALSNANLDQRPFNSNGAAMGRDFPAGEETSIFMIPGGVVLPGLRSGLTSQLRNAAGTVASTGNRRALINTTTSLAITGPGTIVDGTTQTTLLDSNTGQLGSGGTVGEQDKALAQVNRPEVEVSSGAASSFAVSASNVTLRGLSVHGGTVSVSGSATANFLVDAALIGINAFDLAVPSANPTNGIGLTLANLSGTVQNSIIGYAGSSGLNYSAGGGVANSGYTIRQNEFVENGRTTAGGDALSIGDQGPAGPLLIEENLIRLSNSSGIQFDIGRVSDNVVRNNTIRDNGEGGLSTSRLEGSGIQYLARATPLASTNSDLIELNTITSNQSSGIVINVGQNKVRITRNSIFANGSRTDALAKGLISIDFTTPDRRVGGTADYGQGDGVTPNDGKINTIQGAPYVNQPNNGIDYPVITEIAKTADGKLRVKGYVGSAPGQTLFGGAIVEIYSANDTDANQNGPTVEGGSDNVAHGEAQNYVGTLTAAADGTFDVTLANVATAINVGDNITATAYLPAYGTSEAGVNQVSTFEVPLPVELTQFTARSVGPDAELNWATALELNNDRFEVERSQDGRAFVTIGTVAGMGTTAVGAAYSFSDKGVGQQYSRLYYRLRQVDTDGARTYSAVRTLQFATLSRNSVRLYPNPAHHQAQLDLRALPAGEYHVTVLDGLGRKMREFTASGGVETEVDMQGMPVGSYILQVQNGSQYSTLRLVKED